MKIEHILGLKREESFEIFLFTSTIVKIFIKCRYRANLDWVLKIVASLQITVYYIKQYIQKTTIHLKLV